MLARVAPEPLYVESALARGAAPELPAVAEPVPLPDDAAAAPRKPITVAPPAREVAPANALPFRPIPPSLAAPRVPLDMLGDDEMSDEDAEVTPPRGHAALPDAATLGRARVQAWRSGEPVGAVLARLGIAPEAFEAHETALRSAVELEAHEGGSEAAIAWLEALRRA
jgi:hypothetical protein